MTGAIIQLVTNVNAPQNMWIDHNPQITFFKRVYRRHTPFAMETIDIPFTGNLDFGKSSVAEIHPRGDLVYRMFLSFDIPKLSATFKNTKFKDIHDIINTTNFTDSQFARNIKNLSNGNNIALILNYIDDAINNYQTQYESRLNIIKSLQLNKYDNKYDTWLLNNQLYTPIYKLIQTIYSVNTPLLELIPINNYKTIENTIKNDIFNNIFPQISNKISNSIPFGIEFHDTLNTYNYFINVFHKLAKTIPIILSKVYYIDNQDYNIYTDDKNIILDSTKNFPSIVDPNFTMSYNIDINNFDKIFEDNFIPFNYYDSYDEFYPNDNLNPYIAKFNNLANTMFHNIHHHIDNLFDIYKNKLFTNTDKLFFNNCPPLSGIYAYVVPDQPYHELPELRPNNVFNINIWYFYFFKYLDNIDSNSFSNYVNSQLTPKLSINGTKILKSIITLLKYNIEFYMNEFSYLINDLYATSPSVYPKDTLKNYIPPAFSKNINNINISNQLFGFTIIFHRNHIPSIMEFFQFIFSFITQISITHLNKNLYLNLPEIEVGEMTYIKNLIIGLYQGIFKYFTDLYDRLLLGDIPINFNLDYPLNLDNFINYFLLGIGDNSYGQVSIFNSISQMEFYFISEMINIRQQQNFYQHLFQENEDLPFIKQIKDWLLQKNDDIYYRTINNDRYIGKSYIETPYISRFYGFVNDIPLDTPVPLPPTNPYGVEPDYYNHQPYHFSQTFIPVYWNNSKKSVINTSLLPDIQFSIDFYHIKHQYFIDNNLLAAQLQDEYNFNLLKILSLTQYLIDNYNYDYNVLHWIYRAVFNLVKNNNPTINDILVQYIEYLKNSLLQKKLLITTNFLSDIVKILQPIITYDDLAIDNVQPQLSDNIFKFMIDTRNYFLSQYYYYVKYKNSIDRILKPLNYVTNYHQIISQILTNIGFDSLFVSDLPYLFYTYPDRYPDQLLKFNQKYNQLDFINAHVIKNLVPFLNIESTPILFFQDIIDTINNIFLSASQIYDNSNYNIEELLQKYNRLIQVKNNIIKNIIDHRDIDILLDQVAIEKNSFYKFLDDIKSTNKWDWVRKLMVHLNNLLFDSIEISPKIKLFLNNIDVDYYPFIYFFIDFMDKNKISPKQLKNPLYNIDLNIDPNISNVADFIKYLIDYVWRDNLFYQSLNDNMLDLAKNELSLINQYQDEINNLKIKISDILYRSKKAKCAWIRKLAHYLVEEISITYNDKLYDKHISDWLEIYNQISQQAGKLKSYYKMIGHRKDLITFDDKPKDSYTIYLPLIFSFNKNPELSLPVSATNHVKFHVKVKLRKLADVAYKEYMSVWSDPDEPKITKPKIIVEYIFLSQDERKIFISNYLEYLMDEIQYDTHYLLPKNLVADNKDRDYYTNLTTTNKSGIETNILVKKILPVNNYQYQAQYLFNNPSKFMSVLFKNLSHIDLESRPNNFSYFYGEKQWDNYGIYSYYDHTPLLNEKQKNYINVKNIYNNIYDSQFGFINTINNFILKIESSYLHIIKDAYINYPYIILYNTNKIIFMEILLALRINYGITDNTILKQMVTDVFNILNQKPPPIRFLQNLAMDKIEFTNYIINLDSSIPVKKFVSAIDEVYQKYNQSYIIYLLNSMEKLINLNLIPIDVYTLINYYYQLLHPNDDSDIINIILQIMETITNLNSHEYYNIHDVTIDNINYKDIIYQLLYPYDSLYQIYLNLIPLNIIQEITNGLDYTNNDIFINSYIIRYISYDQLLIPNPKINPLEKGYIEFNNNNIMPLNSTHLFWSYVQSYNYFNRSPKNGINLYSWSLLPLSNQPSGTVNLSLINNFKCVYYLHPLIIPNKYSIVTIVNNYNLVRVFSGMMNKIWEYVS